MQYVQRTLLKLGISYTMLWAYYAYPLAEGMRRNPFWNQCDLCQGNTDWSTCCYITAKFIFIPTYMCYTGLQLI